MFDNLSSAKNTEVKKLLSTEWKHLSQPHVMVVHTKYHRTRVQNVPQMDKVKEKLLNKLGYIPVIIFLQQFAKCGDSPGPYRNCDKALMLLYFMVQGLPFDGTGLPKSTLHRVYKFFFKEHYTENKKWAAYALKTWFSTPLLRVLTAQTENPTTNEGREVVTMHGDGHDTEFDYAPVDENEIVSRKDLYSWKLKRTGLRTQVIQDIQGFALMVSDAAKCKDNPDQTMFKKTPIHTLIHPTDVLQLDGGYSYKWIIKKAERVGVELNEENFCIPIKTPKGDSEVDFNDHFGAQRSRIETTFADMGNLFRRYGPKFTIRCSSIPLISVEVKVAWVLFNVKKFVEKYNVPVQLHHMDWFKSGWYFPTEEVEYEESERVT